MGVKSDSLFQITSTVQKNPNMEFFVVRIFPYLEYLFQRQENTDPKNPY